MKKKHFAALSILFVIALSGCNDSTQPKVTAPALVANDTPAHAIERLVGAYERKDESAFERMFTGDYTYEFSNTTDPLLVSRYAIGWFKLDEEASSSHLFSGHTQSGDATLPAASTIDINLAVTSPVDDNSSGVDPATHKLLATRVDGLVAVHPQGTDPVTFVIENNFNVFYIVRGDSAVGLDSNQPPDTQHWYVYKWKDLTGSSSPSLAIRSAAKTSTWGSLKGLYH